MNAWMSHPDRPCATGNPEDWFPYHRMKAAEARRLCAGCPVAAACLAYAIENGEDGVWGGTTAEQRAGKYREPRKPGRPRDPRHHCGTEPGYQRHLYHHEKACDPCKEAHRQTNVAKRKKAAA